MSEALGVRRVTNSAFHPQTNGCVERFNRTLAQDLACFVSTGQDDWDNHVALACFRYNSGRNAATGVSPFEAMFGVEPFMSWGPAELARVSGEPYDLRTHLRELHASLLGRGRAARKRAASHCNATVSGIRFAIGDRVLFWSPDLAGLQGSKVAPPWLGPYVLQQAIRSTGYLLRSEQGARLARVHANRLRRITESARETGDPKDGTFPDSLPLIQKIKGVREVLQDDGTATRHFQVQSGGRSSPRWTREGELHEAGVRAWDASDARANSPPVCRQAGGARATGRFDVSV